MNRAKNHRAFTLIELLVVIAEDVTTRNDGEFNPGTGFDTIDRVGRQHTDGSNLVNADTSAKRWSFESLRPEKNYRRFTVVREGE